MGRHAGMAAALAEAKALKAQKRADQARRAKAMREEGLTKADIGARLGLSWSAVTNLLREARAK